MFVCYQGWPKAYAKYLVVMVHSQIDVYKNCLLDYNNNIKNGLIFDNQ